MSIRKNNLLIVGVIWFIAGLGLLVVPAIIVTEAGYGPVLVQELFLMILGIPAGLTLCLFEPRAVFNGLFTVTPKYSSVGMKRVLRMIHLISLLVWISTAFVILGGLVSAVLNFGGDSYLLGRSVRFVLVAPVYALLLTGFWIIPRRFLLEKTESESLDREPGLNTPLSTKSGFLRSVRMISWIILVVVFIGSLSFSLELPARDLLWHPEILLFVVAVPIFLTTIVFGFLGWKSASEYSRRGHLRSVLLLLIKTSWIAALITMLISLIGMFANIGGDPTLIGTNLQRAVVSPLIANVFTGLILFPLIVELSDL